MEEKSSKQFFDFAEKRRKTEEEMEVKRRQEEQEREERIRREDRQFLASMMTMQMNMFRYGGNVPQAANQPHFLSNTSQPSQPMQPSHPMQPSQPSQPSYFDMENYGPENDTSDVLGHVRNFMDEHPY